MNHLKEKPIHSRIKKPTVDYRQFRFSKLGLDEFRHLKLLIFWPIFGILFSFVERYYDVDYYYPMYCRLDDLIPFNEFFVIPYTFWFAYLVLMHLYTLFYDVESFRKLMKFIMITYLSAIVIYLLFPTCQNLRPAVFPRDNALSRFVCAYYAYDTNTNVFPSIHVMGSLAVWASAAHCRTFRTTGWRTAFAVTSILICLSTVFLKQHSVLDIIAALPICAVAYYISYCREPRKINRMYYQRRTDE